MKRSLHKESDTNPCATIREAGHVRGDLIAQAYAALDAGDVAPLYIKPDVQPSSEIRVIGQYLSTTGPISLERGTAPHMRESHDPPRLSPSMK
jgi:hypothetical protein